MPSGSSPYGQRTAPGRRSTLGAGATSGTVCPLVWPTPAAFAGALETALATVSQELRGSKDASLLIIADDILCCTQELGGGAEEGVGRC